MSNPVSNADVEDVLESIRRLVSEHKKPAKPVTLEPEVLELGEAHRLDDDPEKLVLTASQRIEDAEDVESAQAVPIRPEPFVLRDAHKEPVLDETEPSVVEETAADPEPVEEQQGVGAETEAMATDEADSSDTESIDADMDAAEVEADLEPEPEEETIDAVAKLVASDKLEENADPVAEKVEDDTAAPASAELEAQDIPAEEIASEQSDTADAKPADPFTEEEVTRIENRAARQMKLGAKIAALEAVIGRRDDQWEPDGVDQDAYSGTVPPAIEWEDADESEDEQDAEFAQAEIVDETSDDVAKQSTVEDNVTQMDIPMTVFRHASEVMSDDDVDALDDVSGAVIDIMPEAPVAPAEDDEDADVVGELMMDEDALRVLVTDIVREELQGPLGERITRNVRKLVRREIHRAMTSREFE